MTGRATLDRMPPTIAHREGMPDDLIQFIRIGGGQLTITAKPVATGARCS